MVQMRYQIEVFLGLDGDSHLEVITKVHVVPDEETENRDKIF